MKTAKFQCKNKEFCVFVDVVSYYLIILHANATKVDDIK